MNVHLAADRLPTCSRFIFWNGFVQRVSLYLKKKCISRFNLPKILQKILLHPPKTSPHPFKKKNFRKLSTKKKIQKSSKTHHNSHLSLHGPSPWKQPRRPRRPRAAKWPCPALQKRPPRQPTWACQPGSQLCHCAGPWDRVL